MKRYFQLTLTGRDWWRPFLGFWVIYVAAYIVQFSVGRSPGAASRPGLALLMTLLYVVVIVVAEAVFGIMILRIFAPRFAFDRNAWGFDGDFREFLGLNLKGILLTIITLSIYAPWYIRNIAAYLAQHTEYKAARLEFLGSPRRLFRYFLLGLYVPLIVLIVVLAIVVVVTVTHRSAGAATAGSSVASALMTFVLLVPFTYLVYRWYVDVRWNDLRARWETSFWPSCGFILGQVFLTVVTLGIYGPAAILRLFRCFAARTVLVRGDAIVARIGFEGSIGSGFGLLWGQGVLSLITVGIYFPWAYSRVARWIAGATFLEPAVPSA
jgi:hypothetical protein